jgi:hypothetical protein
MHSRPGGPRGSLKSERNHTMKSTITKTWISGVVVFAAGIAVSTVGVS